MQFETFSSFFRTYIGFTGYTIWPMVIFIVTQHPIISSVGQLLNLALGF